MGEFGDVQVSHVAAAFILEKSNKMLMMFKALKRKPNANTATTAQSDKSSMSSMSQSKQTSAVNCMDLDLNLTSVRVLQSNHSNFDFRDKVTPEQLVIQQSSTAFALLPFLFNDINSLHNDHDRFKSVSAYNNEPITANVTAQMEMQPVIDKYTNEQSFYEIETNGQNIFSQMAHTPQQSHILNEFVEMSTTKLQSIDACRSNEFFVNESKSFHAKQNPITNEGTSFDVLSEVAINSRQTENVAEKLSFKKRLKFKFKTGFQFFKDTKVRCHLADGK